MPKYKIIARRNGPYLVYKDEKILFALCRCGGSRKMPYCDGSHKDAGFEADEVELPLE